MNAVRTFSLFTLLCLFACAAYKKGALQNYAFLYRDHNPFRPQLALQHFSDDSSTVLVHFNTSDLRALPDSHAFVKFTLGYCLLEADNEKLLDSLTFGTFAEPAGKEVSYRFNIPLK